MIEVMVAATILVVIVMMLGMLFQQTSIAWRTGLMRGDGYMQLRAVIGAIQRDANAMIDSNHIPQQLLCSGEKQEFRDKSIQFYALFGSRTTGLSGAQDYRALDFIKYEIGADIVRKQRRLEPTGQWSSETTTKILEFITDSGKLDKAQANVVRFFAVVPQTAALNANGTPIPNLNRYPLFLTVDASVTQRGKLYDVGAESAGPDKKFGTGPMDAAGKDDIRTWAR